MKSAEAREKLLEWYQRDIVPAGDEYTRIVILGGILHPNSFVSFIKGLILERKLPGIYREYPFLDKDDKCLWSERYPDQKSIDLLRLKIGSDIAWRQEYLLQVVSAENQVIPHEWLEGQDYDEMPDSKYFCRTVISVDPASSKNEEADPTAIVVISEFIRGDKREFYIHPNPVNERLSFHEIKEKVKELYRFHGQRGAVQVLVESVAAQQYLSQELSREGIYVKACPVRGDKHARLLMAAAPIQAKMVYFPRKGCELLKQQLIGFGYEPKDDLADAYSQGINELMPRQEASIRSLGCKGCETGIHDRGWRPLTDWNDLFRNY